MFRRLWPGFGAVNSSPTLAQGREFDISTIGAGLDEVSDNLVIRYKHPPIAREKRIMSIQGILRPPAVWEWFKESRLKLSK